MTINTVFTKINDKIPARFNVAVLGFFACFFSYMLRVNMSVNILAMVQSTAVNENGTIIELPNYGPRYPWTPVEVSLVLGSYFWGAAITSIPGGLLSDKYGGKNMVLLSFIPSVVFTAIAPPLAKYNIWISCIVRFFVGFFGGILFPALHRLIAHWAPPQEKGKFISALLGGAIGTVVTWPLVGNIIELYGWSYAFYVPALLTAVFTILCVFLIYESPSSHPRILPSEKEFLENSIVGISKSKAFPPLLKLAKSLPFWSLLLLHYGNLWGFTFLLTGAPKFMNEVLGFNLSASGFLASLPYLVRFCAGIGFGSLGDVLRRKRIASVTVLRKGFCVFSHVIPGILLFALPYFSYDPYMCVGLMTLSLGFNGSATLTNLTNSHDLAPNFAGTLYGIINTFGTTAGVFAPMVVAYFTKDKNTVNEWNTAFQIGAVFYILPALIFMLFGSGEIQPWNEIKTEEKRKSVA